MGEVIAAALENSVSDCQMFPEMLPLIEGEIEQLSADGSYDRRKVYAALNERRVKRATIPPHRGRKSGITEIRTKSY